MNNDFGVPSALDLVRRTLNILNQKLRADGLNPVEEVRYRNLSELEARLLDRRAS